MHFRFIYHMVLNCLQYLYLIKRSENDQGCCNQTKYDILQKKNENPNHIMKPYSSNLQEKCCTCKISKIMLHLQRYSKLESAKKKAEISENFDTSNQHCCDRKEITWNGNGRENDLIAKQEPFLKFILLAIYIIAFSYSFLYFAILSNPSASATSQKCSIFDY